MLVKKAMVIGLACLVAGCSGSKKVAEVDPFDKTRDPSCYTVDLFTKVEFREPKAEVPEAWRGFKGRWGGGKWAGEWCHDLYVLDVQPSGAVSIVETYAPYEPWGKRAAAFRRTAHIGSDGRLRMAYGRVRVEYWLEDGEIRGLREEGMGPQLIALERQPS